MSVDVTDVCEDEGKLNGRSTAAANTASVATKRPAANTNKSTKQGYQETMSLAHYFPHGK